MHEKRGYSRLCFSIDESFLNTKRSQIWIETVIYTLIGLVILGILLSIVTPKINQIRDKTILTQTIDSLNVLNEEISETLIAPGNKREVLLSVSKGEYVIDAKNETIYYLLKDSTYMFSQLDQVTASGNILVLTKKGKKNYDVYLTLNYSSYNITYEGKDIIREFTQAPVPYRLLIENKEGTDKKINIQQV